MSLTASLDRTDTDRATGTHASSLTRIDQWLQRGHRAAATHRSAAPLALVGNFQPAPCDHATPVRRPKIDVLIEVTGTHGTVHQGGKSIEIAGVGEDLCHRLLHLMVQEAAAASRALVVVVRKAGADTAMTVHPGGSVEELSLCCA